MTSKTDDTTQERCQVSAGTPLFNEDSLRDEIARVWGEHGAHAELYADIRKHARRMESDRARLIAALRKAIAEADGWSDECRGVPAENLSAERTLLANLDASGEG